MKLKLLYSLLVAALVLSSCNKDDIEDLQDRVGELENRLGNEPMTITFTGQNNDAVDLEETRTFKFESTDWDTGYIYDYGDGTYYFYIERFADVEWNEGAWVSFTYDTNTDEAENDGMGAYFSNPSDDNYIDANFYSWQAGNTRTVTVNSFDPATGKISVTASATSATDYIYNEYEGNVMNLDLTFTGRLTVFAN